MVVLKVLGELRKFEKVTKFELHKHSFASRPSLQGDHFPFSCDLKVCFRDDIVRRN